MNGQSQHTIQRAKRTRLDSLNEMNQPGVEIQQSSSSANSGLYDLYIQTTSDFGVNAQRIERDQGEFRAKLRQDLTDYFSEEELRTLCFDMNIEYESLPAEGKAGKARELVAQVERNGAIAKLLAWCGQKRPNVRWVGMPDSKGNVTTYSAKGAPERLWPGIVIESEKTLQAILERAEDPKLQFEVEDNLERLRGERRTALEIATFLARRTRDVQWDDLAAQRTAWQAVLQVEPNNQEAQEELRKLDAQETSAQFRAELAECRKPLVSRDIREVDRARSQMQRLLEQVKVRAPELAQEAQTTLDDLKQLRDYIMRVSVGGTSSERSDKLEKAIAVYRKALIVEKLAWILDDQTGEYVETSFSLARAIKKFFDYQIERANKYYGDAIEDLQLGMPDAAVEKLEAAQALLKKVAEGGEETKTQVADQLEKARYKKKRKDQANELVLQAENCADPVQARALLLQAKQAYGAYPDIEKLISARDELIIRKATNEIAGDLARAASELALHRFGEALKACEQALTRGQNLTVSSEEYRQAQGRVKEMQGRITAEQAAYQALQAKLEKVRDALAQQPLPNTLLAARMLKELTPEEARDPEAVELSLRLTLLGESDEVWMEAQRAFHNLQQYDTAARLCESLSKDPTYAVRAGALQRRAEARLYTELALAAEERGKIDGDDGAEASWRKVRALRGPLPADDQYLLDDAEAALKEIVDQRQQQKALDKDFAALRQLRLDGKWPAWHNALKGLEERAPTVMQEVLINERELGRQEWRYAAYRAAENYRRAKRWKDAYKALEPLFMLGILENEDEHYLQARLSYHKSEATRWEQSELPEDLDKAVHHRQEALAAAAPPATIERHDLTATIHLRAIRLAQRKASNPGPHEAYKVLQEQIGQYPVELTEDVEILCYLMYYALEAHDFDGARTVAVRLRYRAKYRNHSRVWQQLVDVMSLFFSQGGKSLEAWEQGVEAFGEISRDNMSAAVRCMHTDDLTEPVSGPRAGRRTIIASTSSQFPDPLANFADLMADHMYYNQPSLSARLDDQEVLRRIHVCGLILRVKPQHDRAIHEVNCLANRLGQIVTNLANQSRDLRARTGGSVALDLMESEALEHRLAAIVKPLELAGLGETAYAQRLAFELRNLKEHKQARHRAAQSLERLSLIWQEVVSETWEVGSLEGALEDARRAGAGRELEPWEQQSWELKRFMEELDSLVTKILEHWTQQNYEAVLFIADQLEDRLGQVRVALRDNAMKLPPEKLVVYDPFQPQTVSGLNDIRRVAKEKIANITEWQRWQRQFENVRAQVKATQDAAEKLMAEAPAHLSKARTEFAELIGHLNAAVALLSELPPAPLASSSEKLYTAVSDPNLIPMLRSEIKDVELRITEVNERLKQVEPLLAEIRAFAAVGRSLSRPADRQLLKNLIDRVRAIDGDHPEIEPYQKLLDKFAR